MSGASNATYVRVALYAEADAPDARGRTLHPAPMVLAGLGPVEVLIILLVLVLLFGAKRLPELARGSGRALRIFKAETRGLVGDDDDAYRKHAPSRFDAAREQSDGERLRSSIGG